MMGDVHGESRSRIALRLRQLNDVGSAESYEDLLKFYAGVVMPPSCMGTVGAVGFTGGFGAGPQQDVAGLANSLEQLL